MIKAISIVLSCVCMLPVLIMGQDHHISRLGVEDGLSSNYVVGAARDRQGFLWFATESGLNRFDGNRFVVFKKGDLPESISANELNTIYADPDEDLLWIGTQRQGLNCLDYRTGNIVHYNKDAKGVQSLGSNDVTDIAAAQDGGIWLSTFSSGVKHFDKKTKAFQQYNRSTVPQLPSDRVWSVNEDKKKQLFIGHVDSGLTVLSLKTGRLKNYKHRLGDRRSLPGNAVRHIFVDKNNNVWLGTDNGLALFDEQQDCFFVFTHPYRGKKCPLSNTVYDIQQLSNGRIAVGTENAGLSILDTNKPFFSMAEDLALENIVYRDDHSGLSNPTVRSIFEDSFGNLWLGTYGGGINFLSHRPILFQNWRYSSIQSRDDVLSNPVAWGLATDRRDAVWVGTDGGGINIFENGKRVSLLSQATKTLTDNAVLAAMRDGDNDLWFGTFEGGVQAFSAQGTPLLNFVVGDKRNDIRSIFQAADGTIWIGSTMGLYQYDKLQRKGELFVQSNSANTTISLDLIRAISEDRSQRLWLGFFGQGVAILDSKQRLLYRYNEDNGFPSNRINHLYRDRKGNMWVATGEGLVCFTDATHFSVFGREHGLVANDIRAIAEDELGNIWLSTINGISRFDVAKKRFYHYDSRYGIAAGDFMAGSVAQTTDGQIYFGSQHGVYRFAPDAIPVKTELPKTLITGLRALQSSTAVSDAFVEIGIAKQTVLKHDQNTFSISFHIEDYSLRNMVEYAYMFEGLDDVWHSSEDSEVTFRNIPYGKYRFLVRTRVVNQDWGKEFARLEIEILPPFWLSWWAKSIYGLLFVLLAWAIVRFYKRKLDLENSLLLAEVNSKQEMELHEERIRFFTNITHELRTPLTLILGPLGDMQQEIELSKKMQGKLAVVHKSATRLMTLVSQLLEFQKTENSTKQLLVKQDNIIPLIGDIAAKYHTYSANTALRFELQLGVPEVVLFFDEQVIVTILENLLSNAFKYTSKGKVMLQVELINDQENRFLAISVVDTGKGIPQKDIERIFDRYYQVESNRNVSGTGIGLALVKSMVALHGAQIQVESKEGIGSSFRLLLDRTNRYPEAIHETVQRESKEALLDAEPEIDSARPIVLVVEDDYDIVDYIVATLADHYVVHTAYNGREGLEKSRTYIPDLIVSDVMMPELDGFEMARALKGDIRTSHIPLIILTAKEGTAYRREGYDIGVDSYLTKPFSAELLKSRIENLLRARNRLAQLFEKEASGSDDSPKGISLQQIDHEFLRKVQDVIVKSIEMDKVDVIFLAEKMSMSHSTLYRKIKGLSDKTPNEFIRLVRFNYAAELLRSEKYTVSEVASLIGISSMTYFRQCFKEQFGVSPTAYVKNISE